MSIIFLQMESILTFSGHLPKVINYLPLIANNLKLNSANFTFSDQWVEGRTSSAGLQERLVGLGQDLVADLGVGDGAVFLAQVKAQLTLVAEVKVTLLALENNEVHRLEKKQMIRYSLIFICFFFKFSFSVFVTHSVRLLSGVNAQVALQGLQVAEAGATGVARVRLLPGMDQNVGPEVGNLKPGQIHTVRLRFVIKKKKCQFQPSDMTDWCHVSGMTCLISVSVSQIPRWHFVLSTTQRLFTVQEEQRKMKNIHV